MKKGYTHIIMVLDRSGSMISAQDETIHGFNKFVDEQKALPGKATLSLVQFDYEYEPLYSFVSLNGQNIVPRSRDNYQPRGSTALLDAVGRTIVDEGEKLAAMKEKDRPSVVILVVITDGAENASKEWKLDKVKQLIEQQQKEYSWAITFLGATLEAWDQAAGMGINPKWAAHSPSLRSTYSILSANIGATRTAGGLGVTGPALFSNLAYTPEQRKKMEEDQEADDT